MLSVHDFHWTCLAISYPLVSFKYVSRKYIEGIPRITIDMIVNFNTGEYVANSIFYETKMSDDKYNKLCREICEDIINKIILIV